MEKGAALASPRGQDAPSGSRDAAIWEGDGLHPALACPGFSTGAGRAQWLQRCGRLGRRWSPSYPGLHGLELISRAAFRFEDHVLIEGVSNHNAQRCG